MGTIGFAFGSDGTSGANGGECEGEAGDASSGGAP